MRDANNPSGTAPTALITIQTKSGKGLGILTIAMLAAGIALLAFGAVEFKRALASKSWPSVTGAITSSSIQKKQTRKNNRTVISYYPRVQYRYTVAGKTHSADRIAFGGTAGGSRSKAQKIVNQYPSGKTLPVYYDPDDPSVAALETGHSLMAIVIILAGLVFLCAGIACFRAWRRQHR
jgi:MFS superfamily sulfate permease-like transporter